MKVSLAPEIKADASLTILVGRINHILAEMVGDVSEEVSAKWELVGDPRLPILYLNLRYEDQGAGTTINPTEMENPARLRSKLRELWGDILQVRLHEIVVRIKAGLREEVGS